MKKIIILGIVIALLVIGFFGYKYFINEKQETPDASSDLSLSKIKEKGKLVVGADVPYGTMEFFNEFGEIVGFDVDIAQKIANTIGVKLEFKKYDFDDLFSSLKNEEIDLVISAVTITEERQKDMLFSIPYFNGGQAIVVRKDDQRIKTVSDIFDKKVGVQTETTGNDLAKKYVKESLIITYKSSDEIINALKNKNIDLLIVDYVEAVNIIREDTTFKIAGEQLTQEFYGVATKLGNTALMNQINEVLKNLKRNGEIDQLKNKWLK